jgi:hypothetical protein
LIDKPHSPIAAKAPVEIRWKNSVAAFRREFKSLKKELLRLLAQG